MRRFFKSPKTVIILAFILLPLFALSRCQQFGAIPRGEYLEIVKTSPQYDKDQSMFVNRRPDILDTMSVGTDFWKDPFGTETPNFLFNSNQTVPDAKLPEVKNHNLVDFQNSTDTVKFIWLGHSSVLLSIDNKIVLFDPIFSDHAAPLPIAAKRFQEPPIAIEDLPPIDVIIISHDHYDHLDMDTVKHFIDQDVAFVTPLGVGSHLRFWGVDETRITELDWWGETELQGLKFAATPSQHFSGRIGVVHNNKTLWASWVIEGKEQSVFFSGDSGYDTHYQDIGKAYGPFHIVFMENGQYNESWRAVHNMPDEAIKGFQELKGKYLVPIHWGMFNLSVHNWYDPPKEITKLAKENDIQLITPRLGQLITLDNPSLFDQWWDEVLNP